MKMPTRRSTLNLVRRVCADFDFEVPEIVFSEVDPNAHTESHKRRILMPDPQWVGEHKACSPMSYRLLTLHELAHWLTGEPGVGGRGHTPEMYEVLFHLCHAYGVPVEFALDDERWYKPRAAKLGFRRWYTSLYAASAAA